MNIRPPLSSCGSTRKTSPMGMSLALQARDAKRRAMADVEGKPKRPPPIEVGDEMDEDKKMPPVGENADRYAVARIHMIRAGPVHPTLPSPSTSSELGGAIQHPPTRKMKWFL